MAGDRRRPWKGALIFSGLVLLATVSVMVFVPTGQVLLEVGVLIAGLLAGAALTRFGVTRRWMGSVVLVVFIAVWFALGAAGYAWFGGVLAGAWGGVAWGRMVAHRTAEAQAAWTVDAQGYSTIAEAREAAGAALRALDGTKGGRVSVERGDARFEVAGAVHPGFICHRTADASDEGSWAVLVGTGPVPDQSVQVPMGGPEGSMPLRLVHDVVSVEAALRQFFTDPGSASFGPGWETGNQAEGTRLTTG
ncbi:hypothetical protein [Arthrobacter sp. B0490]|uniref:hypothetical protein n=1 Tax=Arthrobacter sp. B0490 TaxID=2058891 RepID=UPI0021586F0A|nr:hypothetical protein [Arthrobacter sp. B0490]